MRLKDTAYGLVGSYNGFHSSSPSSSSSCLILPQVYRSRTKYTVSRTRTRRPTRHKMAPGRFTRRRNSFSVVVGWCISTRLSTVWGLFVTFTGKSLTVNVNKVYGKYIQPSAFKVVVVIISARPCELHFRAALSHTTSLMGRSVLFSFVFSFQSLDRESMASAAPPSTRWKSKGLSTESGNSDRKF